METGEERAVWQGGQVILKWILREAEGGTGGACPWKAFQMARADSASTLAINEEN